MKKFKIVDLFSGVGGLTFGFYYKLVDGKFLKRKDVQFIFANEFEDHAVNAFKKNYGEDIPIIAGDICKLSDEKIKELINNQDIDIIIGGPPCQSFSTIGQRRYDERAKLSNQYLRVLEQIKPKMFLFENVKGLLSMKEIFYKVDSENNLIYEEVPAHRKENSFKRKKLIVDHYGEYIIKILEKEFDRIGYKIEYRIMKASSFGIPQNRERVFIIGIRKDLDYKWEFPVGNSEELTIYDAIHDLPEVREGEKITTYSVLPQNEYQQLMRGDCDILTQHYCGVYGDKIRTVIENVKEGEGKEDFNKKVKAGLIDEKYFLTSGYGNTYGRLERNKPSTTITNNLATPSGLRCIHYEQNRSLTPREAARIQSFPDWFQFDGSKVDVTKQIGNAVPPLLSIAFADKIFETLKQK